MSCATMGLSPFKASLGYAPGQKVWLSSQIIQLKTDSKKLSPRFIGPFEVISVINPSSVKLSLPCLSSSCVPRLPAEAEF